MKKINRGGLWCLFGIVAVIALFAGFFFDATVQNWVAQHQSPGLKGFMRGVSRFGDWPAHVALGLLLLAAAWHGGSKKWIRIFLSMLIALAVAGLVGRAIKINVGRARPTVKTEERWNGPHLSSKYHAFPSGHVAVSTAFFATLALAWRRGGWPFLLIPFLIALSRLYLNAHYLSDVVGASLIGFLIAPAVLYWMPSKSGNQTQEAVRH